MQEEKLPCVAGLFGTDAAGTALLHGSLCAGCNTPYFPRSAACHNPDCAGSRMDQALDLLQRAGTSARGRRPGRLNSDQTALEC